MSVVATATTVETGHAHPSVNRPNLTSVGTIIWLSSELMFFAALFAMYFTLRSVTGPEFWSEKADTLNFPFRSSMPKPGLRTAYKYSERFKATAVRLSQLRGVTMQDVPNSLYIPSSLSR